MIFLFHGENQPALRDALLALREGYDEAVFWERELDELGSYLLSPSLLAKRELVIVEDPELDKTAGLIDAAKKGRKDVALIFPGDIPAKKLPQNKEIKVRCFREEIPKNAFPFLGALAAKDKEGAFVQAHRLFQEGMDPHFLLAMIVWQMKTLARVKGGSTRGIHPYVVGKLKGVVKNFSEEDLSRAFSLLLKEDLATKKGKADSATLDFLIEKLTG
jgi:DNA polymerase III delta subunit